MTKVAKVFSKFRLRLNVAAAATSLASPSLDPSLSWSSVVACFAVWLSGIGRLLGYLHLAILRGLAFDLGRLEALEDGIILMMISRYHVQTQASTLIDLRSLGSDGHLVVD